ncbi:MAG: hypothetical protein KAI27_06615, partial [Rhodospirillaceae bacterium]|nr:hypothetical protein [Rhodospirillaceae bacterium]
MNLLSFRQNLVKTGTKVGLMGALMSILVGCGVSTTGDQSIFVLGCIPERQELLEGVDWDNVAPIHINAVENNFRPMVFHF